MFRLGLNPSPRGAIGFKFNQFGNLLALPVPPQVFGHKLGLEWGVLGNLDVGDCVVAGAMHEHMLWTATWMGKPAPFDAATAIRQYSEIGGYVPGDENTDNGLDMATAAAFRRKNGISDTNGIRHKVDAYLELDCRNVDGLIQAAYLFGAIGLGIRVPKSAGDQFDQRRPWEVVRGSKILGGHYTPLCGRNSHGHFLIVTWGRLQAVTFEWMARYLDQAVAYVSLEYLGAQGFSPEGFDINKLRRALAQLGDKNEP